MWAFRRAIAIKDKWVPTVRLTVSLVDPFCLSDNIQGVDMSKDLEVSVVDFSNISRLSWLVGHAGTPAFLAWRAHAKHFPLLKDIKDTISLARAPADSKTFVFVEIRGKTLLVANTPRRVSLALTGHPGAEAGSFEDETGILGWFLDELEKDIKTFKENTSDSLSSCSSSDTEAEDDARATRAAIKKGLADLRASSAVRPATWQPSRGAFRITKRADRSMKELKLVFSKKRKVIREADVTQAVQPAVANGLQWAAGGK